MEVNLLDKMLLLFHQQRTPVTIVLQNNVRISGTIRAFDSYVIVLENQKGDIIYRHAVSGLYPADAARQARPVRQQTEQKRPAPPAGKPAPARNKGQRPAARAPESAEAKINTGMKDGLLRWMQGNKASK